MCFAQAPNLGPFTVYPGLVFEGEVRVTHRRPGEAANVEVFFRVPPAPHRLTRSGGRNKWHGSCAHGSHSVPRIHVKLLYLR